MEIKRILFPTDFSEGSDLVVPYVADLARKYGAKLYILHVIYDIAKGAGWYVPHMSMDELYKDMEKSAQKQLEGVGLEQMRGRDVERTVLTGTPDDEILKFAKDKGIDLIVMGTHGRKGLDKVFFGSTASKVVRLAPCPVLTVREPVKT